MVANKRWSHANHYRLKQELLFADDVPWRSPSFFLIKYDFVFLICWPELPGHEALPSYLREREALMLSSIVAFHAETFSALFLLLAATKVRCLNIRWRLNNCKKGLHPTASYTCTCLSGVKPQTSMSFSVSSAGVQYLIHLSCMDGRSFHTLTLNVNLGLKIYILYFPEASMKAGCSQVPPLLLSFHFAFPKFQTGVSRQISLSCLN